MRMTAILAALCVVAFAQKDCTTVLKDEATKKAYKYDLSALYHSAGAPDTLSYMDTNGNTFYVNFCGETTATCTSGTAVCQQASNLLYYSCGMLSSQSFGKSNLTGDTISNGLMVEYGNGQACSDGPHRHTAIFLSCSVSANPGYFYGAAEGDCAYTLKMYSKHACGTEVDYSSGEAAGGTDVALVILIILIVAIVLYFVLGGVYLWKKAGASSLGEMIINKEFWCDLPFLVKDGFMFIIHGFKKGDYLSI